MKKIFLSIFCVSLLQSSFAQEKNSNSPYREDGKYRSPYEGELNLTGADKPIKFSRNEFGMNGEHEGLKSGRNCFLYNDYLVAEEFDDANIGALAISVHDANEKNREKLFSDCEKKSTKYNKNKIKNVQGNYLAKALNYIFIISVDSHGGGTTFQVYNINTKKIKTFPQLAYRESIVLEEFKDTKEMKFSELLKNKSLCSITSESDSKSKKCLEQIVKENKLKNKPDLKSCLEPIKNLFDDKKIPKDSLIQISQRYVIYTLEKIDSKYELNEEGAKCYLAP